MYPKERILNEDLVYRRVHKNLVPDGVISPGALWITRNSSDAVSVDWNKYSTPLETRNRSLNPGNYAVVSLIAGKVRAIDALTVMHDPQPDNRAHSLIDGEKTDKTRVLLLEKCSMIIPV
jgi:hypothetical protein